MPKFSVASFVKAMSGAKDAVLGGASDKAEADYRILLDNQTQLGALNITSATLDAAVSAYQTGLAAANAATDKAQKARLFDGLATTTHQAVKALTSQVKSWKKSGERQQTLITEINTALDPQLAKIASIKIDPIRTLLKARLQPLQAQVVFARDADDLLTNLAALEKIRATLTDTDVDRLVKAVEVYRAEAVANALAMSEMDSAVSALQPSALKTMLTGSLNAFKDKAKTLVETPVDLFGLVYKSQDLGDLNAQIKAANVADVGAALDRYQTDAAALTEKLTQAAAKAAGLPASPATTQAQQKIADCAANLVTTAQITSVAQLEKAHAGLAILTQELTELDLGTAKIANYAKALAEAATLHNQKTAEIEAHDMGLLGDVAQKQLADLLSTLVPLADVQDLNKAIYTPPSVIAAIKKIDIQPALAQAKAYQDQMAEWLVLLDQKTKEVAALSDPAKKAILQQVLDGFAAEPRILADIATLKDLDAGLKAFPDLVARLQALDFNATDAKAKAYQTRLAEWLYLVNQQKKIAASLPDPAAKANLEKIITRVASDVKTLAEIKTLKELDERLKAFPALEAQITAAADEVVQYQKELAALLILITTRVTELAGALGTVAQTMLRSEFETGLGAFDTLADGEMPTKKLQALRAHAKTVAERKITTDTQSQERLARSDAKAAGTQSQIDGLADPELQKKAQAALDNMKKKLDQLKLGLNAGSLGKEFAMGASGEGTLVEKTLNPKEQMRAMDDAIRALSVCLKDPTGLKMLDFQGGDAFADGLSTLYSKLVGFGANHKDISPAEALSIQRYTGADYSEMNSNRRGELDDDRLAFLNATCDAALAKMPPYPDVAWPSYRFETAWSQDVIDKRYAKGRQFTCGILWSTGARGAAVIGPKSSPFIDHVIYGRKGRDVAALSAVSGEGGRSGKNEFNPASGRGEVLFPADTGFTVEGRIDTPDPALGKLVYVPDKTFVGQMDTKLKEVSNG